MGDRSKIEWTDATFNPIRARNKATGGVGHFCEHVSEGCRNCYAERLQKRFNNPIRYAAQDRKLVDIFLDETVLRQPLAWRKPRMIFVCSMTDLFGEWVPDEWIDRVCAVMALCPQHTFQVLTKRPERMREWYAREPQDLINAQAGTLMHWDDMPDAEWPLPNVWLGVSVEDQATADARIPLLLATPAAVRFVSYEPALGPVDFCHHAQPEGVVIDWLRGFDGGWPPIPGLDWVIVGGESGPGARPMHPKWARSARDQCAAAGVPFFFKQWGEWVASADARVGACDAYFWPAADDGTFPTEVSFLVGKKRAGRLLDGRTHDAMPAMTMVARGAAEATEKSRVSASPRDPSRRACGAPQDEESR